MSLSTVKLFQRALWNAAAIHIFVNFCAASDGATAIYLKDVERAASLMSVS